MKKPIVLTSFGFEFWRKYSKSPGAKAYRDILEEVFFEPDYIIGEKGSVYAFDVTNGVFLHCRSEVNRYTDRLVTLIEYENYKRVRISSDNNYSMLTEWYFYLKSIPLLSYRRTRIAYNATSDFIDILNTRDREFIRSTRKSGYHEWREKMKRKGWLIDREVDNQIMAQRRGEQVLEIVPLEELEATSDMQRR